MRKRRITSIFLAVVMVASMFSFGGMSVGAANQPATGIISWVQLVTPAYIDAPGTDMPGYFELTLTDPMNSDELLIINGVAYASRGDLPDHAAEAADIVAFFSSPTTLTSLIGEFWAPPTMITTATSTTIRFEQDTNLPAVISLVSYFHELRRDWANLRITLVSWEGVTIPIATDVNSDAATTELAFLDSVRVSPASVYDGTVAGYTAGEFAMVLARELDPGERIVFVFCVDAACEDCGTPDCDDTFIYTHPGGPRLNRAQQARAIAEYFALAGNFSPDFDVAWAGTPRYTNVIFTQTPEDPTLAYRLNEFAEFFEHIQVQVPFIAPVYPAREIRASINFADESLTAILYGGDPAQLNPSEIIFYAFNVRIANLDFATQAELDRIRWMPMLGNELNISRIIPRRAGRGATIVALRSSLDFTNANVTFVPITVRPNRADFINRNTISYNPAAAAPQWLSVVNTTTIVAPGEQTHTAANWEIQFTNERGWTPLTDDDGNVINPERFTPDNFPRGGRAHVRRAGIESVFCDCDGSDCGDGSGDCTNELIRHGEFPTLSFRVIFPSQPRAPRIRPNLRMINTPTGILNIISVDGLRSNMQMRLLRIDGSIAADWITAPVTSDVNSIINAFRLATSSDVTSPDGGWYQLQVRTSPTGRRGHSAPTTHLLRIPSP